MVVGTNLKCLVNAESVVYQEECDLVPPKGNFLPLLEGLGFDVRPITTVTSEIGFCLEHFAKFKLSVAKTLLAALGQFWLAGFTPACTRHTSVAMKKTAVRGGSQVQSVLSSFLRLGTGVSCACICMTTKLTRTCSLLHHFISPSGIVRIAVLRARVYMIS
jgi:hypothetical protein